MDMQGSFPVFETGQILGSEQLNNLTAYLEREERRTRNKTIGIGVLCGLEPWYDSARRQLVLEAGVGITSAGHVITVPHTRFNRISIYTPPVMEREVHQLAALTDPKQYPYFTKPNDGLIDLMKLTAVGETPGPTHPQTRPLTAAAVTDRVVILFLEGKVDGIDVCDINECTDKGSLANFDVRVLLVQRQDALRMIAREQTFQPGVPVAGSEHAKYALAPVVISKLNPGAGNMASFGQLLERIVRIYAKEMVPLYMAMDEAYRTYKYLLADIYPETDFPEGPFPAVRASRTVGILQAISVKFGKNVFAVQHIYDLLMDLADSHNEFLEAACLFDAECAPNEARFPMHLLLGLADRSKPAARTDGKDTGFGPTVRPREFFHGFIPSPLHTGGSHRLERLRSLHYRTYLLSSRLDLTNIFDRETKIIPSRTSGATLSERAIPYYFRHDRGDDLHRNWSFDKTIRNQLARVYSHKLTATGQAHPLLSRVDDVDFYRVEGIVGKVLPDVIENLIKERDRLGIPFGIEPVYLGLEFDDDVETTALNQQVRARAQQAFLRLYHCKLKDLDLTFRIIVLFLFSYLTRIVIGLSKSKVRPLSVIKPFVALVAVESIPFEAEPEPGGQPQPQPQPRPGGGFSPRDFRRTFTLSNDTRSTLLRSAVREAASSPAADATRSRDPGVADTQRLDMGSVDARILGGSPLLVSALTDFASLSYSARFAEERERSSVLLGELRGQGAGQGTLTDKLGDTSDQDTVAGWYKRLAGLNDSRELFDKLKDAVRDGNLGDDKDEATANLYPSMLLLDKTEALVRELRAERVADFDFDRFERAYVAFVDAYDAYIKHIDKIDSRADRKLAEAQSEVIAAYGQIASTGVRTGIRSLIDEFEDRSRSIYLESVFENYIERHPGIEHQCGVPKGGTLVLAYVHKSLLGRALGERSQALKSTLQPLFDAGNSAVSFADPRILFPSAPAQLDPLQEFVVVADFALPYRCCDSECEMLEFKPPVVRIPLPKVVSGFVRGIRPNQTVPGNLNNARVKIIDENTGKAVPNVKFNKGKFAFNAAPGTYSIEVRNNGFETSKRAFSVTEGGEHTENFELKRK